jgi:pimeloyl-ACP methyl ester carboxylesterase
VRWKGWLVELLVRCWRGVVSGGAGLALPVGGWWLRGARHLYQRERLADGLAVVLPGIEGRGALSWSICRGLQDGGFPGAVLLWDWTTGYWPLLLYHLRAGRRNRRQAEALAAAILAYQKAHPGRPVYLIGHSGGAAVAVWTLEALPEDRRVSRVVMLGPALAPNYPLGPALRRTQNGMWNFWSPAEVLLLGAGTFIFGTADSRHSISAGLCGFSVPAGAQATALYRARLHQERYALRMAQQFHFGGRFGWANRVFVAKVVAPLLTTCTEGARLYPSWTSLHGPRRDR